MATETKKQPIHKIQVGRVQAAIWEQTPEKGQPFLNVTFTISYKKGDEWKNGHSYQVSDLDNLLDAVTDAKDWMRQHRPSKAKAAA